MTTPYFYILITILEVIIVEYHALFLVSRGLPIYTPTVTVAFAFVLVILG